ncbi:MAG: DUF4424 domain-containing protein [Rhizobiaceae bacterium]
MKKEQHMNLQQSQFRNLLSRIGFLVSMLACSMQLALANDSTARLAVGGLIMSHSDVIAMRSEELYVAMDQVKIRYVFYNRSQDDVSTLVAFPLPDVPAPSDYEGVFVPFEESEADFVGFSTKVDGSPIPMNIEQRAIALGVDRTDVLKQLDVPLGSYRKAAIQALNNLSAPQADRLEQMGLIGFTVYDQGNGIQREARPLWKTKTTFYWTQIFPAQHEVIIEHSYTPATGGSAQTSIGTAYSDESYLEAYCVDAPFIRAVKRIQTQNNGTVFGERRLEYILTTGANWAGPIGTFTLTVDKGSVQNLVSFCGENVRKISPTEFSMTKKEFWPRKNLQVLFLERHQY